MAPQAVEKFPTRAEFSGEVNSVFRAGSTEGEPVEFELVGLDEFVVNDVQENFALIFRANSDLPANQGVYHLAHQRLGEMSVFLVPVKLDNDGLYFEAVFNNLKS